MPEATAELPSDLVDITSSRDGGVLKEIIAAGDGWDRPERGDDVSIIYTGRLDDGTVFDSTRERSAPLTFKLGAVTVIQGFDIVVATMTRGEKARVIIQPEYAYGVPGSPPKIPPNATLVFDLEMKGYVSKKDIFGDGSVVKTELSPGAGWERPSALSLVTVTVAASTSAAAEPFYAVTRAFTLQAGQMPSAWEAVLPDMKKGAQVLLVCKAPRLLGPGLEGVATIPDGAAVVEYRLTLDSWLKTEIMSAEDSSVIKQVLVDGEGWERPNEGAEVRIDVVYWKAPAAAEVKTPKSAPDATVIAAATAEAVDAKEFGRREGLQFCLGDGAVVDGLDVALQGMKEKEVARVTICAAEGFETAAMLLLEGAGEAGFAAGDPVLAVVTLLGFDKPKDMWSLSFEEKTVEMLARKVRGNELFKASRLALAVKSYKRALALFDFPTDELSPQTKTEVNILLVQCHSNLAVCFERLKNFSKVIHHCNKALEIAPSNVKALFRRGSAYIIVDDYHNAESDLKYALTLSAGNQEVLRRLAHLQVLKARQDTRERSLYANMFGRLNQMEEADRRAGKLLGGEDSSSESSGELHSSEEDERDGT